MNKATAPDADQRDRFFGGSDRAGKPILRRSLVVRFGCYLTLLVSLALIGMFSALLFADYTHQDAAVINHAGSLRMLTYRVALEPSLEGRQALLGTLGERLDSGDIRRLLQRQDADDPIRQLHQELREGLARLDPRALPGRAVLDAYVGDIDRFVGILQAKAERRSQLLSTVQGLCLFLSLLVVFVTLYDLSYHVIGPLRELTSTARRLGRGELDARVTYSGEDELAQLGERFNQMAGELKSIYGDLEERVEDKTRALSQSHQRLELLYASARRLGENPYDSRTLQPLLNQLEKVLDAGRVTLCLNKDGVERAYSSLTTTERPADFCLQGDCGSCREQASACDQPSSLAQPLLMQPLSIAGHRFGELFIESRSGRLENWQQQLIETFCDNIARTFALSLQQEQESRLALFAERGTIARELHDSLAQSLSYLKIQVSRLGTLLKREAPAEKIEDTLDELREGLNGAYRQLRELLTTFRLSLDEPSLEAAPGNAVAEFGERGEVTIELDNRLQHVPLSPNEEIHVLQIVREALSNVVRHSQAQRAWVRLSSQADGQVSIAVEDDGVGFDPQQNRSGHYGLTIMQERGQTLGSQLRFEARAPHGTRVLFSFVPTALQPSAAKEPTP
ncbi:ATPase [Pseudomonas aeruginosa]|uniref:two-component system sensor histidine kinase NarX n=1 Tax=Pseudomonas aeruginosa TaxID=287 RepID=UPI00077285DE|nr:two-component system sensor histidine kinase NarX [Pseudomonas aeruginosa]KXD46639.1 ATPase [Pseudomonas aeruginosa]KXD51622.1 ATPase [Pseudomonas aeruginosa]KXD71786.1 ATPase [Pseudomonas aeruginosa]KXD79346.1 ATPase [Pseudomonas aeruginosa]KXD87573.1 ATPase [Pseudomonas aeruginosa]